ncbi:MAG: Peptidase S1 and S6 chymotrypsin/Hap [Parcubacteria group bacterium GW2011_GWA2_51_10]|nr:MAG: Peptidase S1 and S6 chymotrypsin/Hap [Parcubacteria group bacterium GW2011_GWA2_51_10]
MNTILDAVSKWSMVLVFGLLPFFFIPVPWFAVTQSKAVLVGILLTVAGLSWLASRLLEGALRAPGPFVLGAVALLPIAYFVSAVLSGFSSVSLFGSGIDPDTFAAVSLSFGGFALAALIFSQSFERVRIGVRAFFIGALILEVIQILHLSFPAALSFGGAIVGQAGNAFGSWHDLAILAGVLAFLGAAFSGTQLATGRWKYLFHAVIALSIILLVITNFRDVWIAFAVLSFLYFLHLLYGRKSRVFEDTLLSSPSIAGVGTEGIARETLRKAANWKWAVLGVVSILLAFYGTNVVNLLPAQMQVATIEVRPSWRGTYIVGQQSLTNPRMLFFGSGPNTFTNEWRLYKPAEINATQFWNAEFSSGIGSVPTSLITVGVVGFLAWIEVLVALLWVAYAALRRGRDENGYAGVVAPIALSTIFLFAFSVLYVPGAGLSMLSFLLFGLLLALAALIGAVPLRTFSLRPDMSGTSVREMILRPGAAMAATGVLATLIFVAAIGYASYGSARALTSDAYLNRGILAYNSSSDITLSSELVGKAIRISPDNDRAQRAAVQLGLLQLQQLISTANPDDEAARAQLQSTLEQTIQHGLNAVSINSGSYQNWLELASLYRELAGANVQGAYENARAAYDRAREGNPKNPLPLLQLAQLEILQNRPTDALQFLAAALQLKPDFAPAYYYSSQIFAVQNDFASAMQAAANAVKYAENDPLGWYNLGSIAYASGDYANAEVALQQALVRQPQYANALYMLGLTFYREGKTDAALQVFIELDRLNPNQPLVQEILQNIRAGRPIS